MKCEQCGAELPEGAESCPSCGAPVSRSSDASPSEVVGRLRPRHFAQTVPSPADDGRFDLVAQSLEDDPDSGDESSAVGGGQIPHGRIDTLKHSSLGGETAPRRSRRVKHSEDKPQDAHHQPRKHRRIWYWGIAVAIVLGLLVVGAVVAGTYELELWGGKSVPAVIGTSQTQATQAIEAKGLVVQVESRPSDSGVGYVLETDPAVGTRVEDGGTVKLIVSENRTVPEVVGTTLDEARAALEQMGAENVRITYDSSNSAPESTVLSVDPAEGSVFTSGDEITLVVAQAPTVPDVEGQSEADAVKALGTAGLTADVSYVRDESAKAGTVVRSSPAAGQRAGEDGVVRLTVASPNPTDYKHLLEYFSSDSGTLPAWLESQGFSLGAGYRNGGDRATEYFTNDAGDTIAFTSLPWSSEIDATEGTEDVITKGAFWDGLRMTLSESDSPEAGATQVATSQLMDECGFSGQTDACSQADLVAPTGLQAISANFYCVSGESGDYVWTVLVRSTTDSKTEAVCTAAPKALYEQQDLSQYGNSICDFVAYQEMFVNASS